MTPSYLRRPPLPSFIDQGMSDRERAIRAEGGMRLARRVLRRQVEESRRAEERLRGDLALARERLDAQTARADTFAAILSSLSAAWREERFCPMCGKDRENREAPHGPACRRLVRP